ncbi:MAG: hypothetical protein ACYTFT_07610, partial [Planctomycetota bacterium]
NELGVPVVSGMLPGMRQPRLRVLANALKYPLRGATSRSMVIGGGLLSGLSMALLPYQPVVAVSLTVAFFCLLLVYQYEVLITTIRTDDVFPPMWPEMEKARLGFPRTLAAMSACFVVPAMLAILAVQLAPGGLYGVFLAEGTGEPDYELLLAKEVDFLTRSSDLEAKEIRPAAQRELGALGIRPLEESGLSWDRLGTTASGVLVIALVLLVIGMLYYPMALLLASLFDNIRQAYNYPYGLLQIQRVSSDFTTVAALSMATFAGGAVLALLGFQTLTPGAELPIVGSFFAWLIAGAAIYYLLIALTQLTGTFYQACEDDLGWFRRR